MSEKYAALPVGDKAALRQTGRFEIHPDGCGCRKCRRRRAAQARRTRMRYGQAPDQPGQPGQPPAAFRATAVTRPPDIYAMSAADLLALKDECEAAGDWAAVEEIDTQMEFLDRPDGPA